MSYPKTSSTILTRISTAMVLVFLLTALNVAAKIPGEINYQGRLTDDAGAPVADDNYQITFTIYGSEVGTDTLWSSGIQVVTVADGLFTYQLGSGTSLPDNAFSGPGVGMYLGIKVGSDPEMMPRTKINSVAYAYHAQRADTALAIVGGPYVARTGDTVSGHLIFNGDGGDVDGVVQIGADYSNVFLNDQGVARTELYGQTYGSIFLYDGDGDYTASLDATNASGGTLSLGDETGSASIRLDGGEVSNASVVLPEGAISSDEILNEPGVAFDQYPNMPLPDSVTEVCSIELTVPAAGYVHVIGRCDLFFGGTTERTGVSTWISSAPEDDVSNHLAHLTVPSGDDNRYPVYVDGMFFCSTPGVHEFSYMASVTSVTSTTLILNSSMTAMYFPTSYGIVESHVSNPGSNPDAEIVPVIGVNGDPTGETMYQVDLRYYELKAKQERIEALEAELELREARERADRRGE